MTNKETKIRELSDKIDAFQYDADPYEYMDACSTIEEISANLDRIDKALTDKSFVQYANRQIQNNAI